MKLEKAKALIMEYQRQGDFPEHDIPSAYALLDVLYQDGCQITKGKVIDVDKYNQKKTNFLCCPLFFTSICLLRIQGNAKKPCKVKEIIIERE